MKLVTPQYEIFPSDNVGAYCFRLQFVLLTTAEMADNIYRASVRDQNIHNVKNAVECNETFSTDS